MNILQVRFRTNSELRESYLEEFSSGGIFCPTTTPIPEGTHVVCEINAPALPNKVMVRGTVRGWRPALPRLRVRAGASVEFDAAETDKRNFILETMSGERQGTSRRRHTRLPIDVQVSWRAGDSADQHKGALGEISVGGALLRTFNPLPLGSEVVLELLPPGAVLPIAISGTVGYHAGTQSGLRFQYRDGGGSRRLRELIRRLREM